MSGDMKKIKETLKDHEKRMRYLEGLIPSLKAEEIRQAQGEIDFKKLAEKINVNVDKIRELFDIENNTLTLLKVSGEGDREKTQNISLAVLMGYKYLLNNEQILSIELRRNVAENGVPVDNFATYLNEIIPSLIRRKGKPKSPKTTYKLTTLGEARAKELLKKLCD